MKKKEIDLNPKREQQYDQIRIEVEHVFNSGANSIRVLEMAKRIYDMGFNDGMERRSFLNVKDSLEEMFSIDFSDEDVEDWLKQREEQDEQRKI